MGMIWVLSFMMISMIRVIEIFFNKNLNCSKVKSGNKIEEIIVCKKKKICATIEELFAGSLDKRKIENLHNFSFAHSAQKARMICIFLGWVELKVAEMVGHNIFEYYM